MQRLGLFTVETVDRFAANKECLEFTEGCLLDNFIFWDKESRQYFMCLAHYENVWSSCYEVFVDDGDGHELFNAWHGLMNLYEEINQRSKR